MPELIEQETFLGPNGGWTKVEVKAGLYGGNPPYIIIERQTVIGGTSHTQYTKQEARAIYECLGKVLDRINGR